MKNTKTDLRISEVFALTWADVKIETHTISVHNGKGGKSRAVYLTPTLAAQLKVWKIEQTRQRLASSWWSVEKDWLITSESTPAVVFLSPAFFRPAQIGELTHVTTITRT